VVDILPADGSDPVENFLIIENELKKYDKELAQKPRLLAINKMDLLPADERLETANALLKAINYQGDFYNISALNGLGCKELIKGLFEWVKNDGK
jgi:GTP-binding protein